MNRREVATRFKSFIQEKSVKPMDQVCKNQTSGFQLQVQQKFLKDWMTKTPDFKQLLLYHEIGSGKTCTAITMAEQYMQMNKNGSVLVILPARLKTNFYDELLTKCSKFDYMSDTDRVILADPDTRVKDKRLIMKKIREKIDQHYQVWSFERFRREALAQTDIRKWAQKLTKDKFVIVDEVQNMLSYTYKNTHFAYMLENGKPLVKSGEISKGMYTMLFKCFAWNSSPSCKFIYLSATPVYDNVSQFYSLASLLNGKEVKAGTLEEMIEHFRGKVSYFPGTSKSAYPDVEYVKHEVRASNHYKTILSNMKSDAFMSKVRQIGIAYMPGRDPLDVTPEKIKKILDTNALEEYAPKIEKMLKSLKKPGKHLCYCSFVKIGIDFISQVLEHMGFVNFEDVLSGKKEHKDNKVYACWSSKSSDSYKQIIKSRANNIDNIDGKYIKFILGSPAMKEGVSIKHVQHFHLLDPVWNQSGKTQIEGRAIRFCSHIDIPNNHPTLKRKVIVHLYHLDHPSAGTSDNEMYRYIMPKKYEFVKEVETALKNVAIDHLLFKELYSDKKAMPPFKGPGNSPIKIDKNIIIKKTSTSTKVKSSCPSSRRAPCKPGYHVKENKHGDPCCYKKSKKDT